MPENWSMLRYLFCRWFHPPMQDVSETYHPNNKKVSAHQCPACGRVYWWHLRHPR